MISVAIVFVYLLFLGVLAIYFYKVEGDSLNFKTYLYLFLGSSLYFTGLGIGYGLIRLARYMGL